MQAAGVEVNKNKGVPKGVGKPGHESVGEVSLKHVYEIAKIKKTVSSISPEGREERQQGMEGEKGRLGMDSRVHGSCI